MRGSGVGVLLVAAGVVLITVASLGLAYFRVYSVDEYVYRSRWESSSAAPADGVCFGLPGGEARVVVEDGDFIVVVVGYPDGSLERFTGSGRVAVEPGPGAVEACIYTAGAYKVSVEAVERSVGAPSPGAAYYSLAAGLVGVLLVVLGLLRL